MGLGLLACYMRGFKLQGSSYGFGSGSLGQAKWTLNVAPFGSLLHFLEILAMKLDLCALGLQYLKCAVLERTAVT